jgi:hypothetical protein
MKRKFEKRWSTIPPLSTTRSTTSHLKSLNTKNTTTYADGYQGSCLGQTQRCGLIKPVNVIQMDIKVLAWDRHKDVA